MGIKDGKLWYKGEFYVFREEGEGERVEILKGGLC